MCERRWILISLSLQLRTKKTEIHDIDFYMIDAAKKQHLSPPKIKSCIFLSQYFWRNGENKHETNEGFTKNHVHQKGDQEEAINSLWRVKNSKSEWSWRRESNFVWYARCKTVNSRKNREKAEVWWSWWASSLIQSLSHFYPGEENCFKKIHQRNLWDSWRKRPKEKTDKNPEGHYSRCRDQRSASIQRITHEIKVLCVHRLMHDSYTEKVSDRRGVFFSGKPNW